MYYIYVESCRNEMVLVFQGNSRMEKACLKQLDLKLEDLPQTGFNVFGNCRSS